MLYLYIRSTHVIRSRCLYTPNYGATTAAHRRPTVVARGVYYRAGIGPLAARHHNKIELTLFRNCLRNCFTQRNLACTVWIYWAATLQRTVAALHIQLSQPLLTCAVGVDWTTGANTWGTCKSLLALAIWIHWAAELCLDAVRYSHLLELALRLELNVVHVVLFCVEHLNYLFSLFSYTVNIRMNLQVTRVSNTSFFT